MTHSRKAGPNCKKKVDKSTPAPSGDGIFQGPPYGLKNFAILFYHAAKKNQKLNKMLST